MMYFIFFGNNCQDLSTCVHKVYNAGMHHYSLKYPIVVVLQVHYHLKFRHLFYSGFLSYLKNFLMFTQQGNFLFNFPKNSSFNRY